MKTHPKSLPILMAAISVLLPTAGGRAPVA